MKEQVCYAYINQRGDILAESLFKTENDAWQVGLGWPDEKEIEWAKKRGDRVVRVKITEIEAKE